MCCFFVTRKILCLYDVQSVTFTKILTAKHSSKNLMAADSQMKISELNFVFDY